VARAVTVAHRVSIVGKLFIGHLLR
jgi:hypothetical protein